MTEKMRCETPDGRARNREALKALFPGCVTECAGENGAVEERVDYDALRRMLGEGVPENAESYAFNWVGKRKAFAEANSPIRETLRPVPEESIDWDTTGNLFIEGDNLTVLKLLQESYLGAVKMIYIDPPYNTGGDFIYADDFRMSVSEYEERLRSQDGVDRRLFKNTDTNGRYHSDWCSMIYARLLLARNLLTDDGVIFISIDDNEQANLRKICDEVFGESNFIAQCVRKRRDSQANLSKNISPIHEYVFIYAKKAGDVLHRVTANIDENDYKNPDQDPRGPYKTMPCTNKGGAVYTVTTPTGKEITEEWRFKRETYDSLLRDNRLVFPKGGDGKPRYKLFLSEKKKEGQLANTWLDDLASNQEATRELKALFGDRVIFDTPKPLGLLKFCLELATDRDSLILDFFAGSCSTAHAVMQLNAEDGGNRKYIMVQLDEGCDEKSEAFRQGYATISAIGKERIRRVSERMKKEGIQTDLGVRVFRVDESNMKDVYYAPEDTDQSLLTLLESNIKEDRSDLDLLFGCLLEWGLPLSLPCRSVRMDGCTIHDYNDGDLLACFDENIPESVIRKIAAKKPLRAVFRDSGFADSPAKINVSELFKLLAPETRIKVV
ncbi:MAG: site-specific DNA-methyltransferase [Lachnospiraceae bacterium]|nr:site-specific DNA-methyltransferase [Lachnospiraceae bacterium]